jgi:hypothetical protein
VSRKLALSQCKKLLPWLSPFADFIYADASIPLYVPSASGGHDALVVDSQQGVQQGCPLGNVLFALALRPALLELRDSLASRFGRNRHDFNLVAYCDDVFVCGPPDVIQHTLDVWPRIVKDVCCLQVNLRKSMIYPALPPVDHTHSSQASRASAANENALFGVVHVPLSEGITVVGVPVGSDAYVVAFAADKSTQIQLDFPLLVDFAKDTDCGTGLYHAQVAMLSLTRVTAQRANYRLRVVDPAIDGVNTVLTEHDFAFVTAGCEILGDLDPESFRSPAGSVHSRRGPGAAGGRARRGNRNSICSPAEIAALPCRKGGLQWRSMSNLSDVAYLAGATSAARVAEKACTPLPPSYLTSWHPAKVNSKPLASIALFEFGDELGITGANDRVAQLLCAVEAPLGGATTDEDRKHALHTAVTDELKKPSPKGFGLQKTITAAVEDAHHTLIHNSLPPSGKAVMEAASTKGAYAYLITAPSSESLRLSRREMRIAAQRRTQVPVLAPPKAGSMCPRCGQHVLLADGSHAFACAAGDGKHHRHNRLAMETIACARSAGASSRGASCADVDTPYNPNSSPDTFIAAPGLKDIVTDVSWVISERPGLAGRYKERRKAKHALYAAGARRNDNTFIVFLVNNMGGIAADGLALLKTLSHIAADSAPDIDVARLFAPYWTARFSVLAQKIAASAIIWSQQSWAAHERKVGNSRHATAVSSEFDGFVDAHACSLRHGGN